MSKEYSPIFQSLDEAALRLLVERAERLRERQSSVSEADEALEDGGWIAEFSLGGQAFSLPLEQVIACQPLKAVTPLPLAKAGVIGILRTRGKVCRVLSLASLLGSRGWSRDPSVLLLLRLGAEELAVDCEEIPRVSQLPASALAGAREHGGEGINELSLPGGRLLRHLNLEALLRDKDGLL